MIERDWYIRLLTATGFPEEGRRALTEAFFEQIKTKRRLYERFLDLYLEGELDTQAGFDKNLTAYAAESGINENTAAFILLAYLTEELFRRYSRAGIDQGVFWDTMLDFRCKAVECYENKGVWGIFVGGWYRGFFTMERFALGRLQFEHSSFGHDDFTSRSGLVIRRAAPVYNMHIPSCGPLTRASRLDSYKRAYDFYRRELADGEPMTFVCHSWLLYPPQKEFLPAGSNILSFMEDFEVVEQWDSEHFDDGWRVFGKYSELPPGELPTDTVLRRAYARHMASGGKTGGGYGVFAFDGERIL